MQKLLLVYFIIQKIAPQAKSGKYFQIWFSPDLGKKMAAFWTCAGKLSWTLLSPARVQPLYGAGRKESSGTGLGWSEQVVLSLVVLALSFWNVILFFNLLEPCILLGHLSEQWWVSWILNFKSGHCRDGIGWLTRVGFVSGHWSVLVYALSSGPPGLRSMIVANALWSLICNTPSSWKVSVEYCSVDSPPVCR